MSKSNQDLDEGQDHGPALSAGVHASRQKGELPLPDVAARRAIRASFAAALVLLGLWMIRSYVVAIVWAVVTAIGIWPVYRRLTPQDHGERDWLAPLIATLVTAAVVVVPLFLALAEVGREGQAMVQWIADAQKSGIRVPGWVMQLPVVGQQVDSWWRTHLSNPSDFGNLLSDIDTEAVTSWISSIGGELAYRVLLALLTFMTLFLLLRDGESIGERLLDLSERWLGLPGERLFEKMVGVVRGVVNGTVIVAIAEGILIGIGYVLAGLQHPTLFIMLTIAVAMLPLGAWFAFTAAALVLLLGQGTMLAAAGVFGWGAVVMLIGDNIVQPALIGGAARLPFLWTLIGILGGIETFGIIGIFVGPVVVAALLTIGREWTSTKSAPKR
jgi:predicted PurR-regulated permease PerM